jgi:hypothetical protein
MDEFCRRQSIGHVNILKLDIQDGEVKAFRGAECMLSERRVGLFVSVYQGQANFYECRRLPRHPRLPVFRFL